MCPGDWLSPGLRGVLSLWPPLVVSTKIMNKQSIIGIKKVLFEPN